MRPDHERARAHLHDRFKPFDTGVDAPKTNPFIAFDVGADGDIDVDCETTLAGTAAGAPSERTQRDI